MFILGNLPAEQAQDFLSFLGPSEFPYVFLCRRDFTAVYRRLHGRHYRTCFPRVWYGVSRSYESSSTEPIQLHTYTRRTRLDQ